MSTSQTYTFTAVARYTGYTYYCIITDANGDLVMSDRAMITVGSEAGQPAGQPAGLTDAQVLAGVKQYFAGSQLYDSAVKITSTLLQDSESFAPAFIAGILGNIVYEGSAGQFEYASSIRSSQNSGTARLQWLNNYCDYESTYGGKFIYNGFSLRRVRDISTSMYGAGFTSSLYGLGAVQWTYVTRHLKLIDQYIEKARGADTISKAQTLEAEAELIAAELSGRAGFYNMKWIYTSWKSAHASELNSSTSAYDAGVRICQQYEAPGNNDQYSVYNPRASAAQRIFEKMSGQ